MAESGFPDCVFDRITENMIIYDCFFGCFEGGLNPFFVDELRDCNHDRIGSSRDLYSYVVNDGVEIGHGNKISLWLFGFLY